MTYIVVQFEYNNRQGMYTKLLRVFEQSVKENDPGNDTVVKTIPPPRVRNNQCFSSNTLKLGVWVEEMEKLPEGHEICFIDCDMMVLQPPNDVFELDFDIAYTKRPHKKTHRLPVNGGVVFCRNTEKARAFMKDWKSVNDKMFMDRKFHERWRKKYAGMNQSAFGYLMEHPQDYTAKLVPVECNTYNVCNESWNKVGHDSDIRIVHIKSALRKACTSGKCDNPQYKTAVLLWLGLYGRAGGPDIKLQMIPKHGKKGKRRNPIPAAKKKQSHIIIEGGDDEGICDLTQRQNQRRLHLP